MWRAVSLLIFWVLLAGCRKAPPADLERPLTVRIAYTTQLDCALVHLAVAKGFFREEGVEVRPMLLSFGKEALEAVRAGKADLATVAETPFMLAALEGERLSVVASIFSSGMNNAVVANRSKGISQGGDLRGKRIAFTPGTTSQFFLSSFLTAHNIAMEEVTPVHLRPGQMRDALATGAVDAICTWQPLPKVLAGELGDRVSLFYDPHIYTEAFVLAGRRGFVEGNQEAVRRTLRALLKAEEFAARHPAQAQALIAGPVRIAPDILRQCWDESEFKVSLHHALLIALEEETRWALKHGLAKGVMPNYLEFIDPRALIAVKPEAVHVKVVRK